MYYVATKTLIKTLIVAAILLQMGCVNRMTMGSSNIKAIDLAIDCQHDEALTQVAQMETSDNHAYRRMAHVIKSAIFLDRKQADQSENAASSFYSLAAQSEENLTEEEKAQFKKDAECFTHYFEEKRLKAEQPAQCPAVAEVSQAH